MIILGVILKDVTVFLTQCILITLIAIPFGLNLNLAGFLLALPLYALIAATMASMSYSFGLIYKAEDTLASTLNIITLPVSLLSGIILPLALAPAWLQDLAKLNPFSYAVNASRMLFAGNLQNFEILEGYAIITLMALAMFWWSTKSLGRMAE